MPAFAVLLAAPGRIGWRWRPVAACAFAFVLNAESTEAATFAVNGQLDARDANRGNGVCATAAGVCTLRAAIEKPNALAGPDVINLLAGTYRITLGNGDDNAARGDFDIDGVLTINGSGQFSTIVDGDDGDRVFDVQEGRSLTMSNLTVRNGDINKEGGGIRNEGALTLTNVAIRNNVADDGGGVSIRKNNATGIFFNVTFENNSADKGGGLHMKDNSSVTIIESTFVQNSANKDGGGIFFDDGQVTVSASVLYGNVSDKGGGIFIKGNASVDLENTTVSGNTGSKESGGVFIENNGSTADLVNVTVYQNQSPKGAGIRVKDGSLTVLNTIVAGNTGDTDCEDPLTSLGNNIDSDNSCQLTQIGDLPAINPLLAALADNGATTLTNALTLASPARDTGSNAGCPGQDQRRFPRPVDGNGDTLAVCDIGAFEAGPLLMPDYSLTKTVSTLSDPYSASNPKAVPGAADDDSLIITETLPPQTALVVANFDGSSAGPVAFDPGSPASGVDYTFIALDSDVDDLAFSNNNGASYDYHPVPALDGTDSSVSNVRITPQGTANYTGSDPVSQFQFKVVLR